jgi:hypothetical protein
MSQEAELFTPGRRLTQLTQQKPDETALIVERQDGGADTLTRLQLEQWANRLAHRLAEAGVKQKSFVAINLNGGGSEFEPQWQPEQRRQLERLRVRPEHFGCRVLGGLRTKRHQLGAGLVRPFPGTTPTAAPSAVTHQAHGAQGHEGRGP